MAPVNSNKKLLNEIHLQKRLFKKKNKGDLRQILNDLILYF